MVNGNIVEYLNLHPDSDLWYLVSSRFIPLISPGVIFSQSLDVTLGLEYLHSFNPHVIQRESALIPIRLFGETLNII